MKNYLVAAALIPLFWTISSLLYFEDLEILKVVILTGGFTICYASGYFARNEELKECREKKVK